MLVVIDSWRGRLFCNEKKKTNTDSGQSVILLRFQRNQLGCPSALHALCRAFAQSHRCKQKITIHTHKRSHFKITRSSHRHFVF